MEINKEQIVYKKVSELVPYEKNPRLNENAVDKVVESIKGYGFKVPIVIDKNNVIVCGHTRYNASKKLKLKEVPCIIADDLDDKQIKAFRIADNKVSDYSIWDNKLLLEELEGLDNLFTGFETSDIFNNILDEKDNEVLDKNKNGVVYELTFSTQNEEVFEKIKQLIEQEVDFE